MRTHAVNRYIRPQPLPAQPDKFEWETTSLQTSKDLSYLELEAHLNIWDPDSYYFFFLILTGRSTEHVKWLLPSVGPYDMVRGSVIAAAEVCAKYRLQLHTQRATGDAFISEL